MMPLKVQDSASKPPVTAPAPRHAGFVTFRAVLVAILLTFIAGFWIREAEIVALGVYITESVPAVPAVAALLVVLLASVLLRRTRWALARGEMLFVFLFVCVATTVFSCGITRFFLALITAPFYFAQTGNHLGEAQKYLPHWAAVHDEAAITGLYQGIRGAPIPWGAWAVPLLAWGGFFLALWLAMLCLVTLMHRPWVEQEKLSFPLLQLPLEITDLRPRGGGIPAFFRNPVMWAGFGLAFLYNGVNILHALTPAFPAIGRSFEIQPFTDPPWNEVGVLTMHFRPELIGFGYLVSAEISFTIWVTFLLERFAGVFLRSVGYVESGMPFVQEQSLGAYLGIALLLLYMGRRHLAAIARAALGRPGGEEMRAYRWAFWGFGASVAALMLFCRMLGMLWWVAAVYLGIFLAIALTYARLRAETGIPLIWAFPYGMPKALLFAFGTSHLAPGGDPSTLTALAALTFLSRGFPVALSGYQVEGLRAGHQLSERPRRMIAGLTLALVVGLALAFYFHLTGYYRVGAQQVYGGIWGNWMAQTEYENAINWAATPTPLYLPRIVATSVGFVVAAALQILRARVVGFPLNPLGFAAGTAYGSLLWFPFLVVWLVKTLVLRFGGMPLYRKTLPGFLGFALGHFFTAGIVWGLLGATGRNLYEGYMVWFG